MNNTKTVKFMTYPEAVEWLKGQPTLILTGAGSKNQIGDIDALKEAVHARILPYIHKVKNTTGSYPVLVTWGDMPNASKPDVGYALQCIVKAARESGITLDVFMCQITGAAHYGVHPWASHVAFHNKWSLEYKWGGIDENGVPQSNTAKLKDLCEITDATLLVVGAVGNIGMSEVNVAHTLGRRIFYVPLRRKYKGDKMTEASDFGHYHDIVMKFAS